ncbi:SchA/CurD-like domain-containing protein [Streptomyces erythrochromogenes]|uniref:Antibiotic biosynthesis monooxygenase n=1 Tax=Streptomyces erythrochromogenes TaxID=285574 RepID=A0ABZ1QKR1_9ACTN|nr:SchA/CurD-like domain-containing protein [Streptomyces erythrochromogenes]MCX5589333.1 antibiotic biosynthesis monooxygenase [Streptomyces erythrochromogenes]
MTTTLSERVSQSAFDGSMLRVVLLMDLHEGTQQRFFEAYEKLRNDIASVPGHISDQLCQSFENPSQWLITSEWESAPQYLAWVNSEHHAEQVRPLGACARSMRPLKFTVLRETGRGYDQAARPSTARLQSTPRLGAGIVRHALTFTVKPGSEKEVAAILSSYASPAARVDDHTRLCRTSLFMHGNRVVRTVEVQGDLMAALRHVSEQPEVRAVEEAINPYLEQDRDLGDPESARMFFMRAAVPAVHHIAAPEPESAEVQRHAIYYPAKPGCGQALARFLARQDEAAARRSTSPVRSSSIFQRDDIVVRLIDVRGPLKADPETVYGVSGPRKAAVLDRLTLAPGGRTRSAHHTMNLITDRRAPAQS